MQLNSSDWVKKLFSALSMVEPNFIKLSFVMLLVHGITLRFVSFNIDYAL